jgi:hypothetical protein
LRHRRRIDWDVDWDVDWDHDWNVDRNDRIDVDHDRLRNVDYYRRRKGHDSGEGLDGPRM